MARFLAVYTGSADARPDQLDPEVIAKGMQAWTDWMAEHADKIVQIGGPLGKTKRVNKDGVADVRNDMAAFTLVEADSHENAAAIFEGHPHFAIFPGDGVDIMPCLPIPSREA